MFTKHIILLGMSFILCVCGIASAERTLDRGEILEIFDKLTNQPKKTWISAGTIDAVHDEYRAAKTTDQAKIDSQINQEIEEYRNSSAKMELTEELQKMKLDAIPFNVRYRLSNEYSMNSHVVVKYDGERFSWKINVNSRSDSVIPGKELEGNFMTEQFNLGWNTERTFTWDGQKYTIYLESSNQAVEDIKNDLPHVVGGPLTAGVIPWGYDSFTYDNLAAGETSAVEVNIDNRKEIHLTINGKDGTEMLFVLEPEKNYAVLSCLFTGQDYIVARQYGDFKLVLGNWIPMTILVEKYEDLADKPLASDFWKFTSISGETPAPGSFSVDFKSNTIVSFHSPVTESPLIYNYSKDVDVKQLLTGSMAFLASDSAASQNCATATLAYAAGKLEKEIVNKQLSELVVGPDKSTSLYAMKQFAQSLGLHCRVVKTDLATLRSLAGSTAILHMPKKNHFVLLDHIDERYVWLLDFTSSKFFYSVDIDRFNREWSEGTALLVAGQPIQMQDGFVEIADTQLHQFIGAGGYQCTQVIQESNTIYCTQISGICIGYYECYFLRYGCAPAESGSCAYALYLRKIKSLCIDGYYPYSCTVTGEWICYYMYACK
jgi:hypothetical protein